MRNAPAIAAALLGFAAVWITALPGHARPKIDWADVKRGVEKAGELRDELHLGRDNEIALGREVAAHLIGKFGLCDEEELTRYVTLVGRTVARKVGRPGVEYRFGVLNTKGTGLSRRPDVMKYSDTVVIGLDAVEPENLARMLGRPKKMARYILDEVGFALAKRKEYGTRLILSAVAMPGSLRDAEAVLQFAVENGVGYHVSPEICGTEVNPQLRGNAQYVEFMERVREVKRQGGPVLGVPEYLSGIQSFAAFTCHPLLMPTIRPDGKLYYPCLEYKQAEVSILEAGSYSEALRRARETFGPIPSCSNCCHVFCHMALSLLQRHPLSALREGAYWENLDRSAG